MGVNYPYENDPGCPHRVPEPLGSPGIPWARPWDPWMPMARWGLPRGSLMTIETAMSKNPQRQKLSIGASESCRCNASPPGLAWTVLSMYAVRMEPFWCPRDQDVVLDFP